MKPAYRFRSYRGVRYVAPLIERAVKEWDIIKSRT